MNTTQRMHSMRQVGLAYQQGLASTGAADPNPYADGSDTALAWQTGREDAMLATPVLRPAEERLAEIQHERDLFAAALHDAVVRAGVCSPGTEPGSLELLDLAQEMTDETQRQARVVQAVATQLRKLGQDADDGMPVQRGDDLRELADQLEGKVEGVCARPRNWQPVAEVDLAAVEQWLITPRRHLVPADAERLSSLAVHLIREVRATRAAQSANAGA